MPSLDTYSPHLKWIEAERERMVSLVQAWANINSGSNNKSGLDAMREQVKQAFRPLGDLTQEIALPARPVVNEMGHLVEQPTASGLSIIKRPAAPLQLFLNGHLDTVYDPLDPFQKCTRPSPDILIGPGVADMKGGLVILLIALEALEKSPFRDFVGWEAFFSPDEEIGSPGSTVYLQSRAPFFDYGIILEPQFADGAFVSERKGSSTFSLVARGKSAHDGRDFHQGINAIAALMDPLQKMHALNRPHSPTTINIGMINGGTAANRVPDLATARICLRAATKTDLHAYTAMLYDIVDEAVTSGNDLVLNQLTLRTPKPFDADTQALFQKVKFCADLLAMPMTWRKSGGVSDGNTLAALGLPVIDTMGASGGNIHTHDEYINLDKLVGRAQHLALVLMYLAHQHAHHGEES